MAAIGINHVSIGTNRFEETVLFYESMLELERLPTPNFGFRTQWLRCGELQIHVFEHEQKPLRLQHFAIDVDDFLKTYETAKRVDALDSETFGRVITELPDGSLQMYLRDPASNLIEVNWPSADDIDRSAIPELIALADLIDQNEENRRASLYSGRPGFNPS